MLPSGPCSIRYYPPENFGYIEEDLYRSSLPKPLNFPFLDTLKLKTIIYLSSDKPSTKLERFCEEQKIEFVRPEAERSRSTTLSEEAVIRSLEMMLDNNHYPLLVACQLGRHKTGMVVGCLRKLQKWSLSSTFAEYQRYAGGTRVQNEQFIELFDSDLVNLPQRPARWFQLLRMAHREIVRTRLGEEIQLQREREQDSTPLLPSGPSGSDTNPPFESKLNGTKSPSNPQTPDQTLRSLARFPPPLRGMPNNGHEAGDLNDPGHEAGDLNDPDNGIKIITKSDEGATREWSFQPHRPLSNTFPNLHEIPSDKSNFRTTEAIKSTATGAATNYINHPNLVKNPSMQSTAAVQGDFSRQSTRSQKDILSQGFHQKTVGVERKERKEANGGEEYKGTEAEFEPTCGAPERTSGEDSLRLSNPTASSSPERTSEVLLNLVQNSTEDSKRGKSSNRGDIIYSTPGLISAHPVPSMTSIASLVSSTGEDMGTLPVPDVARSIAAGEADSTVVRISSPAVGVEDIANNANQLAQANIRNSDFSNDIAAPEPERALSSIIGITSGEEIERRSAQNSQSRSVDSGQSRGTGYI